ncbi:MAG: hypothetical protein HQ596_07245 [Candidatus Saganbacteria bacterium]|nr:hypothetical protein [Candidatus Saganbacteria bacterium]
MAEEFNATAEGQRICRQYLSKLGWSKQWRQTLNLQLHPGFQGKEFEAKQRQCDQMQEEAEGNFSAEVEHWRKEGSANAKEVLKTILQTLGRRTDLGFFGKRIVDRLRRELF